MSAILSRRAHDAAWIALSFALALGCADSEPASPTTDATDANAAWPRPNYAATEDEAWLFFAVLGEFPDPRPEFPTTYESEGAVRGFEIRTFRGAQLEQLVDGWLDGPLGDSLQEDVDLLAAVRSAPECLALDVRVPDASHYDHLRNALGLVTWFTDLGGVAVIDPQIMRAWSPAEWRSDRFDRGTDAIHDQVALVWSDEGDAESALRPVDPAASPELSAGSTVWMRSRGLRKYARPDVSLRSVPIERFDEAAGFLTALVTAQIDGAVLPTGNAVELPGHSQPVRCTATGDLDDPDFINVHLALEW